MEYLLAWRMAVAKDLLRRQEVGGAGEVCACAGKLSILDADTVTHNSLRGFESKLSDCFRRKRSFVSAHTQAPVNSRILGLRFR